MLDFLFQITHSGKFRRAHLFLVSTPVIGADKLAATRAAVDGTYAPPSFPAFELADSRRMTDIQISPASLEVTQRLTIGQFSIT